MSDTQVLLNKIAALRQRLEQAQGLVRDVTSAAASLPEGAPRLRLLVDQAAEGAHNGRLLDNMLRQLPTGDGPGLEGILPSQLTARASRLLRRGQDLLRRLRQLADQPVLERDSADPLAVRYRETVAMTEALLRMVQTFPDAPSAQLRLCEGLEVILGIASERLAALQTIAARRGRDAGWVESLATLLTGLADSGPPDIKPFVRLAEAILCEAEQAAPLRFFQGPPGEPAAFAAAHSLNVAQVIARLVRHDPEWRNRTIDAVLAALVHDGGMVQVPPAVLAHPGPLDDEQRRAVEGHALRGAEMARRLLPTGPWLAEAAGGHHERLDGRGYPSGLRDVQIGPLTRLLAVCDTYSALCCPRPHRPALDPRTALTDTLLLAEQGVLDAEMAERLLHLSFYPVGTVVELADGAVGLVVATHQNKRDLNTPARPVLALLTDGQRQLLPVPRHLDLAECEGHSIVRSLPPEERRELLGKRFPELT